MKEIPSLKVYRKNAVLNLVLSLRSNVSKAKVSDFKHLELRAFGMVGSQFDKYTCMHVYMNTLISDINFPTYEISVHVSCVA